jgi:hypothetical protein
MELYSLHSSFLLIPIAGMIRFSRSLWLQILMLGAGLSLACAQNGEGKNQTPPTTGKQPTGEEMPTCYARVPDPRFFTRAEWQQSQEMVAWAVAEQQLLAAIKPDIYDHKLLSEKMMAANNTYKNAAVVVSQGLMSQSLYDYAGSWLSHWHRSLEEHYAGVMCYMVRSVPPVIDDINRRLITVEDMKLAGKVDSAAVAQVQAAIREQLGKERSPQEAQELSDLIMGLTGFVNL